MKTIIGIFLFLFTFSAFSKDPIAYRVDIAVQEYCTSLIEYEFCYDKVKVLGELYECMSKKDNNKARIDYNLKDITGHTNHKSYEWIKNKALIADRRYVKKSKRCKVFKDERQQLNCLQLAAAERRKEIIGFCSPRIKNKKSSFFDFIKLLK